MTTTVKVSAHCSGQKEVVVEIFDNASGQQVESFKLQDGESADRVVFDGRELTVKEVLK